MKVKQIEITEFQKEGYRPLVDYEHWRVAALRFCEDLKPEAVTAMQKHMETDEVFVLLSGKCILYTGGAAEVPGEIGAVCMEAGKLYNVKKGIWHNHTMSKDGTVLIVENRNTSDANSPIAVLNGEQKKEVCRLHLEYIGGEIGE